MKRNPHPKITALRAVALLAETETGTDEYKARKLREAVRTHLLSLIVSAQRRRL